MRAAKVMDDTVMTDSACEKAAISLTNNTPDKMQQYEKANVLKMVTNHVSFLGFWFVCFFSAFKGHSTQHSNQPRLRRAAPPAD